MENDDAQTESIVRLRFDSVDGDQLHLVDDQGQTYQLVIDHDLRLAIRQGPSDRVSPVIEPGQELRPKDIQALIRSGVAPDELAQAAGLDAGSVDRYAQPVLDERAYVAQRARALRIRPDDEAPLLGDITVDRLATLKVETASLDWDAVREDGRWVVSVSFNGQSGPATARWLVDLAVGKITALDDEAAWITETDIDHGRPKSTPLLQALRDDGEDAALPTGHNPSPTSELSPTLALLDDLMASRGIRQPVDPPFEAEQIRPKPASEAEVLTFVPPTPASGTDDPPAPPYSKLTLARPPVDADPLAEVEVGDLPDRRSIHERVNNLDVTTVLDRLPRMGSLLEEDASVGFEAAIEAAPNPTPASPNPTPASPTLPPAPPSDSTVLLEMPSAAFPTSRRDGLATTPPEPAAAAEEPAQDTAPAKPRSRAKRSSVPSWDEIVFGAKPER